MTHQQPFAILRKPLVVGGLGLTAGVWLWESVAPTGIDLGGTLLWGSALAGSGLWWLRRRQPTVLPPETVKPVSLEQFRSDAERLEAMLTLLRAEGGDAGEAQAVSLEQRLQQCRDSLTRNQLTVALVGGDAVGKTTVARQLQHLTLNSADYQINYQDTPGLFGADADEDALATLTEAMAADVMIMVVVGDLVDAEYNLIQALLAQGRRVLVACNKWDRYLPAEQPVILQQIRHHLSQMDAQDIFSITAAPSPIKRRQHQADGTVQEAMTTPDVNLAAIKTRLEHLATQEGRQLVLASASRQLRALVTEAQGDLNGHRRQQATPVIERYQWLMGATAFANPLPTLDVVAAAAINGQMVLDVSKIYQRSLSLERAEVSAKALIEVMAKLGLVEIATQAISPLLKSHLATYAAGGVLQGLSAAYLTRVAGLSLLEYYETHPTDSEINVGRLTPILQGLMSQQRRLEPLKRFVQQGIVRLAPAAPAAEPIA
ncbi:MAG: DUF697 domain-containing protein [Elainellaceae cyanobacterium]